MGLNNARTLKSRRRQLRASLTPAEAALWLQLQRSQLGGRKFRRQHSFGPYILDFYCPSERLAIELDGAAHDSGAAAEKDAIRNEFLNSHTIRVTHFENRLVFENLEGVLVEIRRHYTRTTPALRADPSSKRRGVDCVRSEKVRGIEMRVVPAFPHSPP